MLEWNFEPQIVSFLPIRWYGVIFAAMLMVAFQFFRWRTLKLGRPEPEAEAILVAGVIAVIGGSRLGHVLFYHPGQYFDTPAHWINIFKVWEGGLASHGATIGILIALVWWSRKFKVSFLGAMDRFSFSACIGVIFVRIANFTNSEIIGRATDLAQTPWAIRFVRSVEDREWVKTPGDYSMVPWRHPAQLYEALKSKAEDERHSR